MYLYVYVDTIRPLNKMRLLEAFCEHFELASSHLSASAAHNIFAKKVGHKFSIFLQARGRKFGSSLMTQHAGELHKTNLKKIKNKKKNFNCKTACKVRLW